MIKRSSIKKGKDVVDDVVSTVIPPVSDELIDDVEALLPTTGVPEAIDFFLEGKGERLRGEFASIPHLTLVIGNRAVRAVFFKDKWFIEPMARRGFMFSDVHGIPWRKRNDPKELGVEFNIGGAEPYVAAYGMSIVAGKSGGGKTVLMNMMYNERAKLSAPAAYVNVGEPVPQSSTDLASILLAIVDAITTSKAGAVILFDSFKGPLFTTAGAAGAGGFTRPFFQDLSDLSSILARFEIAGVGAVNFQSEDTKVVREVTEALIGNTVGVFEVVESSSTGGNAIGYRYYRRNYISGQRDVNTMSVMKPEFIVYNGEKDIMTTNEVADAIESAFINAPSLDDQVISTKRVTRSLFNKKEGK